MPPIPKPKFIPQTPVDGSRRELDQPQQSGRLRLDSAGAPESIARGGRQLNQEAVRGLGEVQGFLDKARENADRVVGMEAKVRVSDLMGKIKLEAEKRTLGAADGVADDSIVKYDAEIAEIRKSLASNDQIAAFDEDVSKQRVAMNSSLQTYEFRQIQANEDKIESARVAASLRDSAAIAEDKPVGWKEMTDDILSGVMEDLTARMDFKNIPKEEQTELLTLHRSKHYVNVINSLIEEGKHDRTRRKDAREFFDSLPDGALTSEDEARIRSVIDKVSLNEESQEKADQWFDKAKANGWSTSETMRQIGDGESGDLEDLVKKRVGAMLQFDEHDRTKLRKDSFQMGFEVLAEEGPRADPKKVIPEKLQSDMGATNMMRLERYQKARRPPRGGGAPKSDNTMLFRLRAEGGKSLIGLPFSDVEKTPEYQAMDNGGKGQVASLYHVVNGDNTKFNNILSPSSRFGEFTLRSVGFRKYAGTDKKKKLRSEKRARTILSDIQTRLSEIEGPTGQNKKIKDPAELQRVLSGLSADFRKEHTRAPKQDAPGALDRFTNAGVALRGFNQSVDRQTDQILRDAGIKPVRRTEQAPQEQPIYRGPSDEQKRVRGILESSLPYLSKATEAEIAQIATLDKQVKEQRDKPGGGAEPAAFLNRLLEKIRLRAQ